MRTTRALVLSDTHTGSVYGCWHHRFATDKTPMSPVQRVLFRHWASLCHLLRRWKPSLLLLNGDLIDGPNYRSGGRYVTTTSLAEQAECALALVKMIPIRGGEVYGVAGGDYSSSEFIEAHRMIVESLGGECSDDQLFIDVHGHTLHLSHGSSPAFVYYEQVLAREGMFADQTSVGGKIPDAEILLRAHWHKWIHIQRAWKGDVDRHILVGPGVQGQDESMSRRSPLRLVPDVGAILLSISRDRVVVDRVLYPTPVVRESVVKLR
jgi:hypothetical protein